MANMNDRLLELKYNMKEKVRIQGVLAKLIDMQKELEIKKEELHGRFVKEELDVKKLEGISIGAFIHMLKGDKVEKLDKEKQEAFSAKLKYDEVCSELDNISREIRGIDDRITAFGDLQREYMRFIEEKEQALGQGFSGSDRLADVIEKQAEMKSRQKELDEAYDAGSDLMASLQSVKGSLDSASGWGTWDMLGGGMIATMAKHSRIDEAKMGIERAQSLLRRFHRELMDVGGTVDINIEIGSFLTFADYFFDGIFADWAVQSRIHDAQAKVEDTIYKVNTLMHKLKDNLQYTMRKVDELDKERIRIIEEA